MCDSKFPRNNARWTGQCEEKHGRGIYYYLQLIRLLEKLTGAPQQELNYARLPVSANNDNRNENLRKLLNRNQR